MKTIIILVIVLCSCNTPQPIVYYKEPRIKIVESGIHRHGRMPSPHYIPNRDEEMSHYLITKYDLFYRNKHAEKGTKAHNSAWSWLITYLLTVLIISI
jgi:hypothetical protein